MAVDLLVIATEQLSVNVPDKIVILDLLYHLLFALSPFSVVVFEDQRSLKRQVVKGKPLDNHEYAHQKTKDQVPIHTDGRKPSIKELSTGNGRLWEWRREVVGHIGEAMQVAAD